jgi:LPXTG-site transpeptidase (sortase) family protein
MDTMPSSKQSETSLVVARIAFGLIAFGVLLAIVAVALFIHHAHMTPKPPAGALTSRSAPSSVKPSSQAVASYTVSAYKPKYLAIPAIGIDKTRVFQLGLTPSGAIAVPDDIYDTGWYDGSSLPGQPGAMFIYGHVSSWTADGVFYSLKQLKPGDKVVITRGDNKVFTYHVVSTKVYPYNHVNMNRVLSPIQSDKPGLNLMTCTGQVIKGSSEFNERLVVFTSLASS